MTVLEYKVYVLESLKDNNFYIGYSGNLERRLLEHQSGRTKSLKNRLPVKLVFTETYKTKEEAQKRERQIKAYKGGEGFKKLIQPRYQSG